MIFKVGDKVKLKTPPKQEIGDAAGVVIGVSNKLRILWDIDGCVLCGDADCGMEIKVWTHWPHEIEHIIRVGQQLLFDFTE